MSIRKEVTKKGEIRYVADVYNEAGKKFIKRFKKKTDAVEYVTMVNNQKREQKLIGIGLKNPSIGFKDAIENFKKTKCHLRPKTIQKYNAILNEFSRFVEYHKLKYLNEFTTKHATYIYDSLTQKRYVEESNRYITPKPKTINSYLALIKEFFKYEVERDSIVKSPMAHIKNVRVERKQPDFYTKKEIAEFFKYSTCVHPSYRFAFQGLLFTGMRVNELINVQWGDIDWNNELIKVSPKEDFTAKTINSYRNIPIHQKLLELLLKENENKNNEKYVFSSPKGRRLRERTLLEKVKKIGAEAKMEHKLTLHRFRHTFASHLVMNRVPIERVQKLLGHSSINETQIYAHLSPKDMHSDVNVLDNLTE